MTKFDQIILAENVLGLTERIQSNPLLLAKMQEVALLLKEVYTSIGEEELNRFES